MEREAWNAKQDYFSSTVRFVKLRNRGHKHRFELSGDPPSRCKCRSSARPCATVLPAVQPAETARPCAAALQGCDGPDSPRSPGPPHEEASDDDDSVGAFRGGDPLVGQWAAER